MLDVTVVVALILGIVEMSKRLGLPSKWSPVLSLVLGVAYSFTLGEGAAAELIVEGIVLGLTASGLYSGTKTVVTK